MKERGRPGRRIHQLDLALCWPRGCSPLKKCKRDSQKEKVTKALKVLTGRGKDGSSSSEAESDDGEEEYLHGGKDGDLLSRLTRGFAPMHEQLGTLYGDSTVSGAGSAKEVLQPAAVRYLLSSALPLVDTRLVGEEKLRELRALATGLDMLVQGRVSMTAAFQELAHEHPRSIHSGL